MSIFSYQWTLASLLTFLLLSGVCSGQTTTRASVDSQGAEANSSCRNSSISTDGRYVAFSSPATNLVPGDLNGKEDIFVCDRQNGTTDRISVNSQGVGGTGDSLLPSISGDGRFVAFSSAANNLVPGDGNGTQDVFVHDRQTGVTQRINISYTGGESSYGAESPSISGDGRFVAYNSFAADLVPNDGNSETDVFVYDRQTGTTKRISLGPNGVEGNDRSRYPNISTDGRYVAFESDASNLVVADWNSVADAFVHDCFTLVTWRVSVDSMGYGGNRNSSRCSISADGRYAVFESYSDDLVPADTNGSLGLDIFLRDRLTRETKRVSVDSFGVQADALSQSPMISANGNYVVYQSGASNLVPGDTNGKVDIFVHGRQSASVQRVSVNSFGAEMPLSNGLWADLSGDGRIVCFESLSSNLVPGDTNDLQDIFCHDRWDGLGANSVYLAGPSTAPVGMPLDLSWASARPNSDYWLACSLNLNGGVVDGHIIDVGTPWVLLAAGSNSESGTGNFHSPQVPQNAAGLTCYFELVTLDVGGILYDSNALETAFY